MNRLTRTVFDDFAAWMEAHRQRPVDLTPIADLCAAKAAFFDRHLIAEELITEPDPRLWPGAGWAHLMRGMLGLVPTEADWLVEAVRALPLFFDYLATLDDPLIAAEELAGARAAFIDVFSPLQPLHPSVTGMIFRLTAATGGETPFDQIMQLPWRGREVLGGPTVAVFGDFTPDDLPPVPVPSIVARMAGESELLARFLSVARASVTLRRRPDGVDDWIWRQVVLQALTADIGDPDGLYPGPSLRQWDSGRPELRTRVWTRAFQCLATQSALGPDDEAYPPLVQAVLAALRLAGRSGEVRLETIVAARPDAGVDPARLRELVDRLESLGAVTVDDDTVRLTTLGSAGLHQLGNWTGVRTAEPLVVPSWSDDLVTADVVAVMNADADGRVGEMPPEGFPRGWVERADREQLAGLLLDAMPWLTNGATARAWGVLLTIGEPAVLPVRARFGTWLERQARAWLIVTGFGHKDLLPPEEASAVLTGWNAAWDRPPSTA